MKSADHHKGLRAIAILEASKGIVVLIVGMGLLLTFGEDGKASAIQLIHYLHLNPTGDYAGRFIRAMARLEESQLSLVVGVASIYSAARFIEAYGLWMQRRWAEWFAALSGAIYIPIELYELYYRPSWITFGALLLNIGIVGYMVWVLRESKLRKTSD